MIHKENGGLCSARNAGFAAARGKWIMFVDGDDWIDADMCEQMLEPGVQEDVDLVMCGITSEYGHSSQEYKFYLRDYAAGRKVYTGEGMQVAAAAASGIQLQYCCRLFEADPQKAPCRSSHRA